MPDDRFPFPVWERLDAAFERAGARDPDDPGPGSNSWVLAGSRTVSGKPILNHTLTDADALNGNNVRFPVSWRGKNDVSHLANQPVRLRFKLRDCKLYAFQFVR